MNRRQFISSLVVAGLIAPIVRAQAHPWANNKCREDADGWTSHYLTHPEALVCQCGRVLQARKNVWQPKTGFMIAQPEVINGWPHPLKWRDERGISIATDPQTGYRYGEGAVVRAHGRFYRVPLSPWSKARLS